MKDEEPPLSGESYRNGKYFMSKIGIHIVMGDVDNFKKVIADIDVNKSDEKDGITPLHLCAVVGRIEMAQLLLKCHADINLKDKNGCTPLDLAFLCQHKDMQELLSESGGVNNNFNKKKKWWQF